MFVFEGMILIMIFVEGFDGFVVEEIIVLFMENLYFLLFDLELFVWFGCVDFWVFIYVIFVFVFECCLVDEDEVILIVVVKY